MDRLLTHDEAQELLGAYAVHALEPDESVQVECHLVQCELCTEELDELFEASAALGMTELATPGIDLWDRIKLDVRSDSIVTLPVISSDDASTGSTAAIASMQTEPTLSSFQTEAIPSSASSPTRGESATPIRPNPGVAEVIRLDAQREHRRERSSRWKIAAASAAAAVAIAVPATLLIGGGSPTSIAALAKTAAKQTGSRTIVLNDASGKPLAEAVLTATGQGYVRDTNLPELPVGQTYQLWYIDNGVPVSSGLLGRSPKVSAFGARLDVDAIAISVEPASGSVSPTTTPIAVATLA